MRKIIIQEFITLDGVMQAPGGPEEDTEADFRHGGWTEPYFREADDEAGDLMQRWMKSTDLLLGRKTFEIFAGYWPTHEDVWPGINQVTKYVMSNTLKRSTWQNSVFLKSICEIESLKNSEGSDLQVFGSGELAQALFKGDLVDELRLMTFPITLGAGKRLFSGGAIPAAFIPMESLVTANGVIFASYRRSGEVKTGSFA